VSEEEGGTDDEDSPEARKAPLKAKRPVGLPRKPAAGGWS
jgi:hypothetical protein